MPRDKVVDGVHTTLIAVDFDGTLVDIGDYPAIGAIKPGAAEALAKLYEMGYKLYILTARPDLDVVEDWLENQPVLDAIIDDVTNVKKPETTLFIDDRGFRFDGTWDDSTINAIVDIMKYHATCAEPVASRAEKPSVE